MRIVAGERKGMRLVAPRGGATRPTSDMIREATFGILGDVAGLTVLEPFAGTGALGLEALSRGAASASFCEVSEPALRALRENVRRLGYEQVAAVRRQDGRRRMAADHARGTAYDLLLLDPPYRMLTILQDDLCLHLPDLLVPGGRVVVEGAAATPALALPVPLLVNRVHGGTRIAIYGDG
jgi:16S rRNA (guanine966-N2)-methyltransferase